MDAAELDVELEGTRVVLEPVVKERLLDSKEAVLDDPDRTEDEVLTDNVVELVDEIAMFAAVMASNTLESIHDVLAVYPTKVLAKT